MSGGVLSLRGVTKQYAARGGPKTVLADIADAPSMNRAWDRWLDQNHKPARMTIQAALVDPSWRVEITGIAAQV